jgi:hypothetical protein
MVAVACILCASSAGASAAQHAKHGNDPARWYQGDSTQQQRMNVLKKELNAAYAEQTAACKKKSSGKRSACLKEARANYQRDSANARQLIANAPQSEITERVVSTTPAGDQDRMQGGASAYGSSGAAGQTGAGTGASQSGSGTTQSMGAGTGATQSDTQDQPRAGAVPPVQR